MSEEQTAPEAAEAPPAQIEAELGRAERWLYGRIAVGCVLFVAFAALDISAALTHTLDERMTVLLALLIGAIFALPRRPLSVELISQLRGERREQWIARQQRLRNWLAAARGVFFLAALLLMFALPRLVS